MKNFDHILSQFVGGETPCQQHIEVAMQKVDDGGGFSEDLANFFEEKFAETPFSEGVKEFFLSEDFQKSILVDLKVALSDFLEKKNS